MDDAFLMLTLWFLLVAPKPQKSLFNVPVMRDCSRKVNNKGL